MTLFESNLWVAAPEDPSCVNHFDTRKDVVLGSRQSLDFVGSVVVCAVLLEECPPGAAERGTANLVLRRGDGWSGARGPSRDVVVTARYTIMREQHFFCGPHDSKPREFGLRCVFDAPPWRAIFPHGDYADTHFYAPDE